MIVAAWLLGCAVPETDVLADVVVDQAELRDVTRVGAALIIGHQAAPGGPVLAVLDPEGTVHEVPVRIRSTLVGLLMTANVAGMDARVPLTLPRDREIRGHELFGTYEGSFENLSLLGGVQAHHLQNEAGVRIDRRLASIGFGAAVAHEWMQLRPDDDDGGGLDLALPEELP